MHRLMALTACAFVGCSTQIPDSYDPDTGADAPDDATGSGSDTGGDPMPAGTVLWSSIAWANGHARTLTDHGSYDPDDPKLELAAGVDRKWWTTGDGTS